MSTESAEAPGSRGATSAAYPGGTQARSNEASRDASALECHMTSGTRHLAPGPELPQQIETLRVLRAALEEQLQDLHGFPPPARAEIQPGQRHVGHLEAGIGLEQVLERGHGARAVAASREHEGEVVRGLAVA